MQVGKNLDAVEGFNPAGMVEVSLVPAADSEIEEMGPESSVIAFNSPLPPQGSPNSVITVWAPTEFMVAQLCRMTLGGCMIADEPGLGKTLQARGMPSPARPHLPRLQALSSRLVHILHSLVSIP